MSGLFLLDWVVCGGYFALIAVVNIVRLRFRSRSEEDYFVGGRHLNWIAVGVSMFATGFSSVSFLGLPQRGAFQDFSYYLTILLIPLLIAPVLCVYFVPLYVTLRVSSGYEYLRLRFGVAVQRIGSLLYCCYAIGSMGAMLYAVSLTMKSVLDLTYPQYLLMLVGLGLFTTVYTAAGGLGAVVWTDVFQSATLGLAAFAVLYLSVHGIAGGWSGLWAIGNQHDKFTLLHLELLTPSSTSFQSPISIYTAVAFAMFMYLPGYAVSQNMILRYVCAGTIAHARRVVVLSALVNVAMGFLLLLLGVSFFVYYAQPDGPGMPALDRQDQILPHFIKRAAVPGLTGLMMAGMFAAASAMDSGISGVASVLCYDWLGGRQFPVRIAKMLTVLLGFLVIGVALAAPALGDNVLNIVNTIAGTMLGALMPVFLLGMFSRRANSGGVLLGLATSAICLGIVVASRNISASWYSSVGMGSLGESSVVRVMAGIPTWWYGAVVIIPGLMVGQFASRLFQQPSPAALRATFEVVRKGALE